MVDKKLFYNMLYSVRNHRDSIIERKKKIYNLRSAFKSHIKSIASFNLTNKDISKAQTILFDILPVVSAFNCAYRGVDKWIKDNNKDKIIQNKVIHLYQSKGLVCIFINTELSIHYLFTALISAIAAGNKIVIHVLNCDTQLMNIVNTIINKALSVSEILVLSTEEEILFSLKTIEYNFYYVVTDNDSYNKYFAEINSAKVSFLNTSFYISVSVFDKQYKMGRNLPSLLQLKSLYKGKLFFASTFIFMEKANLEALILEIKDKKNNLQILRDQNKNAESLTYRFDSQQQFNEAVEMLIKISTASTTSCEILFGGHYYLSTLEMDITIIKFNDINDVSSLKYDSNFPFIYIVPFTIIQDISEKLFDNPPNILHIYSDNKKHIYSLLNQVNAELHVVNDSYNYRFEKHLDFAEGGIFYKHFGGFVNFSNFKSVFIKKETLKNVFLDKSIYDIKKIWSTIYKKVLNEK